MALHPTVESAATVTRLYVGTPHAQERIRAVTAERLGKIADAALAEVQRGEHYVTWSRLAKQLAETRTAHAAAVAKLPDLERAADKALVSGDKADSAATALAGAKQELAALEERRGRLERLVREAKDAAELQFGALVAAARTTELERVRAELRDVAAELQSVCTPLAQRYGAGMELELHLMRQSAARRTLPEPV